MRLNLKAEQTLSAWLWRAALGPATVIDGVLSSITLGTLHVGLGLESARRLSTARFASQQASASTKARSAQ